LITMKPMTIAEIQEVVRSGARLSPRGGGSKPALLSQDGFTPLETGGVSGLLEYEPQEFTFTALAGTPLAEIEQALATHGQFLPFDPPLAQAGATLGGCVAAGLSGPGRYRYGGLRDFLLGVRFVDAQGQLVSSGGKVVKNAAGFDLPKLMIGSLGQYGILVELTFKVFPRPETCVTLEAACPSLEKALETLIRLTQQPLELFALDLVPQLYGACLRVRLGGSSASVPERTVNLRRLLEGDVLSLYEGAEELQVWQQELDFTWAPADDCLVKVPLTPRRLLALDEKLAASGTLRHYSVGANLAWIAWHGEVSALDSILNALDLPGLLLRGPIHKPYLGARLGEAFARRVKQALDPRGIFPGAFDAA
jgi:glycolate oxidase FAD binding subunit